MEFLIRISNVLFYLLAYLSFIGFMAIGGAVAGNIDNPFMSRTKRYGAAALYFLTFVVVMTTLARPA